MAPPRRALIVMASTIGFIWVPVLGLMLFNSEIKNRVAPTVAAWNAARVDSHARLLQSLEVALGRPGAAGAPVKKAAPVPPPGLQVGDARSRPQ